MNTRQKKKYIRRCAGKNVRIDWSKPYMGFIGEWAFGPKLINPTIKQRYHELLWSKRWIKQLKKLAEEAKESEQYMKDNEMGKHETGKEISTLSGPDKWIVNNSRTGKETECSIKGGENIEYPASATIRFDEGPSFLQVRYRPHRGSLKDSIALAKRFNSPSEMFDHIVEEWGGLIDKEDLSIGKEDWGPDPRIDWPNCHYVLTKRCGGTKYDTPQCIGMCCYEGHMLVEDAVVISESAAKDLKMKEEFEFPKVYTGAEKSGYNKNLKMLHDAANYWMNKAREERSEKKKEE